MTKNNKIAYLKYKGIAKDWIKNRFNDIQVIYSSYYPQASKDSLDTEPYRLLDSVRFKEAFKEVIDELDVGELDLVKTSLLVLYKEATTAKNSSDRTTAAIWLGKTGAIFTEKQEIKQEVTNSSDIDALIKKRYND